jgi:sigma-B regulation protein RsbU (phosphoserine phosphatase)
VTNLWTDIEALTRLAESQHAAEEESSGGPPIRAPRSRHVFPAFPERQEFDIHAIDSPAGVVTGDSHDFFFVTEDTLAFLIADVSGKGIPAALLVGVTRAMVRNLSSVSLSPGDTLTRVNRILHQTELGAMYVTIFLGWYDTGTGVLQYANAGHPLPYRIDAEGKVRPFGKVTGPILGILDVKRYTEDEEQLAVGERLVLYTDGVTEAANPKGEFFGADRLAEILGRHGSETVKGLCQGVMAEVSHFQGDRSQDDATVLALQRRS